MAQYFVSLFSEQTEPSKTLDGLWSPGPKRQQLLPGLQEGRRAGAMAPRLVPHSTEEHVPSVSRTGGVAAGGGPSALGSAASPAGCRCSRRRSSRPAPGHRVLLPSSPPSALWGFAAFGLAGLRGRRPSVRLSVRRQRRRKLPRCQPARGELSQQLEFSRVRSWAVSSEALGQALIWCKFSALPQSSQQRSVKFAPPEKLFLQ